MSESGIVSPRAEPSPLEWWLFHRVVPAHHRAMDASMDHCEKMTTDELKALWDSEWPIGDVKDGIYLEHIHVMLNRRGEGRYCAV